MLRILRTYLPLAVIISCFSFITYGVIQQDIRTGANDPQIQFAEDTSQSLQAGNTPALPGKIDVAQSLSPFIIIYDRSGEIVKSTALLNGNTPVIPQTALLATQGTGSSTENRITWQPEPYVRLATVIVHYTNGYVLAGRNMREIEYREDQQFRNIMFGYVLSLIAAFVCVVCMQTLLRPRK